MFMSISGGAMIISGLMAGAMFGGIEISLVTIIIGIGCLIGAVAQEKQKEKHANEWRKNYPAYRY